MDFIRAAAINAVVFVLNAVFLEILMIYQMQCALNARMGSTCLIASCVNHLVLHVLINTHAQHAKLITL